MTTDSYPKANIAFSAALDVIADVEPAIAGAIRSELHDQRSTLKLIASENYASPAVLLTMGSWMSDKYAEGSPGHRFMRVATTSTWSSHSPSTRPSVCSAPTTPTSSHIVESMRISLLSGPCSPRRSKSHILQSWVPRTWARWTPGSGSSYANSTATRR
jgi:hypothetical protein